MKGVLMLRAHGQIYCSMQYLHIRHPWRKWAGAVFSPKAMDVPAKSMQE